jgi:hypothetical protein
MRSSDPSSPWELTVPQEVLALPVGERLQRAVKRVQDFHDATGYQRLFSEPLIPASGLSERELRELEAEVGAELPAEYRLFLQSWRYLIVMTGYHVWGVGGPFEPRPWVCTQHVEGRRLLSCGDLSFEADGDDLVLDLDDPAAPALVWLHDYQELRPFAESFSLAICKVVEYLLNPEDLELSVQSTREAVEFTLLPWWKRFLRRPS